MRSSSTLILVGAVALVATVAGSAYAEADGRPVERRNVMLLETDHYVDGVGQSGDASPDSRFRWVGTANDSPTDTNSRALKASIADTGAGGHDFVQAWTRKALRLHTPVSDVQNISLEVRGTPTAGRVRVGIRLDNNAYTLVDVSECLEAVPGSTTWKRADFTGATSGCALTIFGTTYEADGVHSAWQVYAEAHPQRELLGIVLRIDGPGMFLLDRIALGTNRMYNLRTDWAVRCGHLESSC